MQPARALDSEQEGVENTVVDKVVVAHEPARLVAVDSFTQIETERNLLV